MSTSPVPEPSIPTALPLGLTEQGLRAWREHLETLPDDAARVRAAREQLSAARALARYVVEVQAIHGARMYLAGVRVRAIARVAGVSDSLMSRRMKALGLAPRLVRQPARLDTSR